MIRQRRQGRGRLRPADVAPEREELEREAAVAVAGVLELEVNVVRVPRVGVGAAGDGIDDAVDHVEDRGC